MSAWVRRNRSRLALTATAFAGAVSAAFCGFFGGRLLQMWEDLGDGMNWSVASSLASAALWLFVAASVLGGAFLHLAWVRSESSP